MTEEERMLSGKLYIANDPVLSEKFAKRCDFLDEFNSTKWRDFDTRQKLIIKNFGKVGKNACINKPFYCDYAFNIYVGDNFYANYDCVLLDVAPIHIGNNVFLAPRVSMYTAGHPIDKDIRNEYLEYGKPINIGDDVWIGGSVIICPGVTIGSNVVIGAGSVVVKDIPSNCVAVGNPCKKIRDITQQDKDYWNEKKKEYYISKENG